jgi:hypothetical protein
MKNLFKLGQKVRMTQLDLFGTPPPERLAYCIIKGHVRYGDIRCGDETVTTWYYDLIAVNCEGKTSAVAAYDELKLSFGCPVDWLEPYTDNAD